MIMKRYRIAFAITLLVGLGGSLWSQTDSTRPPYLDPALPVDQRVDDLVSRMTLEEKASQVVHNAAAIPRLQIPAYNWWTESLHGVIVGTSTVFPEPIGLAATFDVPLIHNIGDAIGTEVRAKYHEYIRQGNYLAIGLDVWAPNINIVRDPRWGRGQETYGEDPFLTGRLAIAYVTGIQGDDPHYLRVIATPKHYAVHSGPEPLRHTMDMKVSKHDEEDTYLWAFRAAVTEGKAGSVMCVFNSVNGEPGCANVFLLKDQLREKWKFQGYVVTDCDSIYDIYHAHHYVNSLAEAAAVSMKRGVDLDCNHLGADYSSYLDAIRQGLITEADLNVAVKRLMRARFLLGMFDPPEMVAYTRTAISENDSDAHRQLALESARESMVLLKNDGVLPLKRNIRRLAVIGPLGDQIAVLEGNYNGTPSRATSILEGIRQQFGSVQVAFAPGTLLLRTRDAIPASAFTTEDGTPGLRAEYFAGRELQGAPVATRIDRLLNFDFTGKSAAPGLEVTNISARWTGFVSAPISGTYEIGISALDGCRFWFDGRLVVDHWGNCGTTPIKIGLVSGRKYAVKVEFWRGGGSARIKLTWLPPHRDPLQQAVNAAKQADVIVATVGITSELENEESPIDLPGFKGGDRTTLDLPKEEETLMEALKATGKPLVVVLTNGSALAVNWAKKNADAILEAWYPGEEGGKAVAETLAGVNNPAGRLPITFYRDVNQLPPFEDYSMNNRTYRYFKGEVLYPFGYGMSYSHFTYTNLQLSARAFEAGKSLDVDAEVRNLSQQPGDEISELYLTPPQTSGAPTCVLRGFSRIHLPPKSSKRIHFTLTPRDLSLVNEAGDRAVVPGNYFVTVGSGQPGTGVPMTKANFTIRGYQKLPE